MPAANNDETINNINNELAILKKLRTWKDISTLETVCEQIEEGSQDESETRQKFEKAIQICGMDILFGGTIFRHYLNFEVEEHVDLIETEGVSDVEIKKSKQRLMHIIHRQLGLPLIGNELALQEISSILSEYFNEADEKLINPKLMKQKYDMSLEKRSARMIYEEKLYPETDDESSLTSSSSSATLQKKDNQQYFDTWLAYIKFEISEKEFLRVQRLYERCLVEYSDSTHSTRIYLDFIDFALKMVKNWALLVSICEKALTVESIGNMPLIWHYYLMGTEMTNSSVKSIDDILTVNGYIKIISIRATNASALPSADDYFDLQLAPCDHLSRQLRAFLKRRVSDTNSTILDTSPHDLSTIIQSVQSAFSSHLSDVATMLTAYYPDWAVGWLRYFKYKIYTDELVALLSSVLDDGTQTAVSSCTYDYKTVLNCYNTPIAPVIDCKSPLFLSAKAVWEQGVAKYSQYSFIWTEYLQWAKSTGNRELCAKLYKRAVATVTDGQSTALAREWLNFTRQQGSVDDILFAIQHTQTLIYSANSSGAAADADANTTVQDAVSANSSHSVTNPLATAAKVVAAAPPSSTTNDTSTPSGQGILRNTKKRPAEDQDQDDHALAALSKSKKSKSVCFETPVSTESSIISNAANADANSSLEVPHVSSGSADHANSSSSSINHQQPMNVEAIAPSAEDHSSSPILSGYKVFVRNLPFTASEEDIKNHFLLSRGRAYSKADTEVVKDVRIILSKVGKSRGLAIVELASEHEYNCVLELYETPFKMLNPRGDNATAASAAATEQRPVSIEPLSAEVLTKYFLTHLLTEHTNIQHPTTVFVSKLSKDVTSAQLKEIFAPCGEILEARVVYDKRTGESKCHGLVQFVRESGRREALNMNKRMVHGHAISVLPSKFPAFIEKAQIAADDTPMTATTTASASSSTSSLRSDTANGNDDEVTTATEKPNKYIESATTSSSAPPSSVSNNSSGSSNAKLPARKSALSVSSSSVLAFRPRKLA